MVRNARAKITRIKNKHGVDLSGVMPTPNINSFETRKEFNAWKEKQSDFTNRYNIDFQYESNKYGVPMTKRKRRSIEKATKLAQKAHDIRIAKYADKRVQYKGEDIGSVSDQAGLMSEGSMTGSRRPKDFDFDSIRHADRLDTIQKNMDRKSGQEQYDKSDEQLKENFMTALRGSFNSETDELIEMIERVPADDFYELFLTYARNIDFSPYDSEGNDVGANMESLAELTKIFNKYHAGKEDMDFKGF